MAATYRISRIPPLNPLRNSVPNHKGDGLSMPISAAERPVRANQHKSTNYSIFVPFRLQIGPPD